MHKTHIIPVVALMALVVFISGCTSDGTGSVKISDENEDVIKIPISEINDGAAHFYSYESSSGKTIRFFVLKSSDNVYRAAFDTCDVCYEERKGYRQEGDYMVCNNCGRKFASTRINIEQGGCNPAPLDREVQGNNLIIKKTDLEKGGKYF